VSSKPHRLGTCLWRIEFFSGEKISGFGVTAALFMINNIEVLNQYQIAAALSVLEKQPCLDNLSIDPVFQNSYINPLLLGNRVLPHHIP